MSLDTLEVLSLRLPIPVCSYSAPSLARPLAFPFQAKKWALMSQSTGTNGVVTTKPVGTACDECFSCWQTIFAFQYTDFEAFASAYHRDSTTAAVIDAAFSVHRKASVANFPQHQVTSSSSVALSVSRHYIFLSEADLRAALGVARLLKSHTRSLTSVKLPCEEDLGKTELFFAFCDPQRPWRTGRLSTSISSECEGLVMDRSISCYPEQGAHCFGRTWTSDQGDAVALSGAKVLGLSEFLASQGVSSNAGRLQQDVSLRTSSGAAGSAMGRPAGGGSEDESDEGGDGGGGGREELVGIAASGMGISLTSPARPGRPQVPPFVVASSPPASTRPETAIAALAAASDAGSQVGSRASGRSGNEDSDDALSDDADG